MPVTDRTRKILWVEAAGRCSICQASVVTEGTDTDEPSVFGEEAHIVGQSPNGPRAGEISEPDSYANLILLCRKHHKQVDDQVGYYTVERLKEIKRQHEEWTASLGETTNPGPVRVIPDPTRPAKKTLKLVISGTELFHFVDGADALYPRWPSGLGDEHEDLIAALLDNVQDWGDISGGLAFSEKRNASRSLNENIEELSRAGFIVGVRERFLLLTGGIPCNPLSWRAVEIEVQPFGFMRPAGADGKPVDLTEAMSKYADIVEKYTDADA